jgi:hypothetical protein
MATSKKSQRSNSIQKSGEQKEETRPVAFRLTQSVYDRLFEKCEAAGLTRSEWLRDCVLENRTEVIARNTITADAREVLRVFRSASNNINQIAHRANADNLAGILSESSYMLILEELREQTRLLKGALKGVIDRGAD